MLTNKEISADIRWHEGMIKALLTIPDRDKWETQQIAHHNSWVHRLKQLGGA